MPRKPVVLVCRKIPDEVEARLRRDYEPRLNPSDRVYSGGQPEGDEAFATLRKLGVKTLISVDGTKPDVERAAKFGLRYVHIPHGYAGISSNTAARLAKAAATVEGPIFVHCHRGKHRGPKRPATTETRKAAYHTKTPVFGMVERGGEVRAMVMPKVSQDNVEHTIWNNVDRDRTRLMTDEHPVYFHMAKMLPHGVIRHESEYVRGEVHTNTMESFWAILKRGLIGTYHHVDAGYLNMYVNEYEFRHNSRKVSDRERFLMLASKASDGRLEWYIGQKPSEEPS